MGMNWRPFAACRGEDPDRFAPEGLQDVDLKAWQMCDTCPVKAECHAEAHETNAHKWTIHGGELPHQFAFKGAKVVVCGWCLAPIIVGARASEEEHFCNNRCRFRRHGDDDQRAHGAMPLFEVSA